MLSGLLDALIEGDLGQSDIIVDVHAVYCPQVVHPVFEVKQVRAIHCHSETGVGHLDLNLKMLSRSEGEVARVAQVGQVALLLAPSLPDLTVPHNNLIPAFVKAWVKVENQVGCSAEVDGELVWVRFDSSTDGDQVPVLESARKVLSKRHRQVLLRSETRTRRGLRGTTGWW